MIAFLELYRINFMAIPIIIFYVRSVGVQYLVHNPDQFIESKIEHSWQDYLQRMSNQGTWADVIIIQAVQPHFIHSYYGVKSSVPSSYSC